MLLNKKALNSMLGMLLILLMVAICSYIYFGNVIPRQQVFPESLLGSWCHEVENDFLKQTVWTFKTNGVVEMYSSHPINSIDKQKSFEGLWEQRDNQLVIRLDRAGVFRIELLDVKNIKLTQRDFRTAINDSEYFLWNCSSNVLNEHVFSISSVTSRDYRYRRNLELLIPPP